MGDLFGGFLRVVRRPETDEAKLRAERDHYRKALIKIRDRCSFSSDSALVCVESMARNALTRDPALQAEIDEVKAGLRWHRDRKRLEAAGHRLRNAVTSLDSYAAASFPCPLGHSQEADEAVKAWDQIVGED